MPLEVTAATYCGEDRKLRRGGVTIGADRAPTPMALSAYHSERYFFYVKRRTLRADLQPMSSSFFLSALMCPSTEFAVFSTSSDNIPLLEAIRAASRISRDSVNTASRMLLRDALTKRLEA